MSFSNLIDKFVGKPFEIDCVDIEAHGFEDHIPPLFKRPGVFRGDCSGKLSFKLYNQIPVTKENFIFLKELHESDDPKSTNIRLSAKDYDGIDWTGGWTLPITRFSQSKYFLVEGDINPYPMSEAKLILTNAGVKQASFEGVTYNGYFKLFRGEQ